MIISFSDGKNFKRKSILTFIYLRKIRTFYYFWCLGSHINIIERASDQRIGFSGSYPNDYEFKNNTFIIETMVQINLGMLNIREFRDNT